MKGTIHLYGNQLIDHSINIEKQLTIKGYNEATISSHKKSVPVFLLKNKLFLTSLHLDNINLLRLLKSTENKMIAIHMCQFTSSTINIEPQNTPSQTHFSIDGSNFTGGAGLMIADSTLIIADSRFESNNAGDDNGGALFVYNSQVTIAKSRFERSAATYRGGALYVRKSNVTITETSFISNTCVKDRDRGRGGGIYSDGSSITINDSKIKSNNAGNDGWGGGIYLTTHSSVIIANSTIESNNARTGGGIYIATDCSVIISNSTIKSNTAASWNGGGIYLY